MSGTRTYMYEAQKKTALVYQPEQRLAPQVAYQRVQMSGNELRSTDLWTLQRTVGNRSVQRILQGTLLSVVQRTLRTRREVQHELARITGATEIPLPVISELLQRLRLRRRLLTLHQRREQLARQHIRCFPNGDCGFVGLTQSEFTTRDSRLIDQIQELQDQVIQSHSAPVQLGNVGLGVGDPLGRHHEDADVIRIAETTYVFAAGEEFRTETRWRERKGFPQLPQERPQAGLVYLFVAVTSPTDIAANTLAAANTAHRAVRANTAIFNANEDWAGVEEVDSINAFISLLARINAMCQRHGWRVRQLEVFSHGGLDGPMFGRNRQQFDFAGASERGARPLAALTVLPFTGDAVAFFRGCRIGAGNFLAAFAQQQRVATYGFAGTTSFSNRPGAFYAWQQGEPAYQLEFPGSETVSQILGRHPSSTPPRGYVPERTVAPVQRKTSTGAEMITTERVPSGGISMSDVWIRALTDEQLENQVNTLREQLRLDPTIEYAAVNLTLARLEAEARRRFQPQYQLAKCILREAQQKKGITVAVYVTQLDTITGTTEFQRQAKQYALDHQALGLANDSLRMGIAMELTSDLPSLLQKLNTEILSLLAQYPELTEKTSTIIPIHTLAIFTHGEPWRLQAGESGRDIGSLPIPVDQAGNRRISPVWHDLKTWVEAIAPFLSASPQVLLFACWVSSPGFRRMPFAQAMQEALQEELKTLFGLTQTGGFQEDLFEFEARLRLMSYDEIKKQTDVTLRSLQSLMPGTQEHYSTKQKLALLRMVTRQRFTTTETTDVSTEVWGHTTRGHTVANPNLLGFKSGVGAVGNDLINDLSAKLLAEGKRRAIVSLPQGLNEEYMAWCRHALIWVFAIERPTSESPCTMPILADKRTFTTDPINVYIREIPSIGIAQVWNDLLTEIPRDYAELQLSEAVAIRLECGRKELQMRLLQKLKELQVELEYVREQLTQVPKTTATA